MHRNLPMLFDEITPESLQEMGESLEVQSSYGESKYRICVKKVHIGRSADFLNEHGIVATIRRELGSDIDAACGQLRRKNL